MADHLAPPSFPPPAPAQRLPDARGATVMIRPPLVRQRKHAWLGGVASGIAAHLGWPVWLVRSVFVLLMAVNFVGLALYGALWVLIPSAKAAPQAPGLEAAKRLGMRGETKHVKERNWGALMGVLILGFGVVWLVQAIGYGVSSAAFLPLVLAVVGIAIVWQAAERPAKGEDVTVAAWARPFVGGGRVGSVVRIILGLGLVGSAMMIIAIGQIGAAHLPAVFAVAALMLLAFAIVAAPWLHRWRHSLQQARDEKLLADARADMAAHLHDSVLQTLALIQRQSEDPRAVASLARRQERELRTWLYGETTEHESLKVALAEAVADVEDERGVAVEFVCVGDAELTPNLNALVLATREAILNAAKHSGADVIDVYAEVEDDVVEVFIRDRGAGFDVDTIAADRMGVRGSIIERMTRHGGRAAIRSAPGEGTEVRLEMSR